MVGARHLGVAGLSAIAVAFGFARYGYGLFLPEFRAEFGLSTGELGVVASGAYASYLAVLLATGALVSRVGPRLPVVVGGLCAGIGMLAISLAPNAAVLIAGVLLAATSPGWSWAPFSDAVSRMVGRRHRGRTLSVITTGTTFGIVVGGSVAFAAGAWRAAWLFFAVAAFVVMVWNLLILPSGPHGEAEERPRLSAGWFFGWRSARLFGVASVFGFGGTVYWTYAVDLIKRAGLAGPAFWTVVGVSGIAGVATGDLIERAGLRRSLVAGMAALGAAPALLGLSSSSWVAAGVSAVLFGAAFMVMSALLVNWTSAVFPGQPGTGFSATQLFIAAGTIAGPAVTGAFAERFSLQAAFLITAVAVLASVAVRPAEKGEG